MGRLFLTKMAVNRARGRYRDKYIQLAEEDPEQDKNYCLEE